IFPYPARLRALLAPLRLAERLGIRGLLRSLVPRAARDWLDLLPELSREQVLFPSQSEPSAHPGENAGDSESAVGSVVVHHGCVAQVLNESANLNSERALAAAGYALVQLGRTVCCGALDVHHGNLERARQLARTNVAEFTRSGAGSI